MTSKGYHMTGRSTLTMEDNAISRRPKPMEDKNKVGAAVRKAVRRDKKSDQKAPTSTTSEECGDGC